jgi:hypothetical protein
MHETARVVFNYLLGNPVVYLGVAFIAGIAASKTVAYEGRAGVFSLLADRSVGFILGSVRDIFLWTTGISGETS